MLPRDELERLKTEAFHNRIAAALSRIQPEVSDGDTEPTPTEPQCDVCDDKGMVTYPLPTNHPDFGRAFPCPNPHCAVSNERHRQQWARRIESSRIPKTYLDFTFESWEATCSGKDSRGKRLALAACQLFVESPEHCFTLTQVYERAGERYDLEQDDTPRNSLMLTGPMGVGKTGLAIAAINAVMERGEPALYIRARDMLWEIQDRYDRDSEDKTSALDIVRIFAQAPILMIDEFNVANISKDRQELIEAIMRYRYPNRLPTIMTANVDQDQFTPMWGDWAAEATVAMAHWVYVGGAKLRKTARTAREG